MRTLLLSLVLLASLAACGKKKAPASPANAADTEAAPSNEEQDMAKPDDQDSDSEKSADPCEGGE